MIELTEQQGQAVGEAMEPIRVVDRATHHKFFLVRAEVFAHLQSILGDIHPRETYTALDQAFAAGWNEPKMSDYDNYEAHER